MYYIYIYYITYTSHLEVGESKPIDFSKTFDPNFQRDILVGEL